MDANTEFLQYIYQNSEMGKNTMKDLIDINEDVDFFKIFSEATCPICRIQQPV